MAKLRRSDKINAYISAVFPLVFAAIYFIAARLGFVSDAAAEVLNIYIVLSAVAGVAAALIIGKLVKR